MSTEGPDLRFRNEEFWMNDVHELYRRGNYLKFFPKYNTTRIEQLNAITRMCLYFIALVFMFNKGEEWLYLPITLIVFVVILYNVNQYDLFGGRKELNKLLGIRSDKKKVDANAIKEQYKHDANVKYNTEIDTEDEYYKNYDLEAAYIDSNGDYQYGSKYEIPKAGDKREQLYTVDELEDYRRNTCRRPTIDNPFMNPSILDYNNNEPPVACNADDDFVDESTRVNFNHNLFRNVDELWERENSQRQFYTVPNTAVPNNQTEFAKWLYKIPSICKENHTRCLRYEDIRFKR